MQPDPGVGSDPLGQNRSFVTDQFDVQSRVRQGEGVPENSWTPAQISQHHDRDDTPRAHPTIIAG